VSNGNITVAPGQTVTWWLGLGGQQQPSFSGIFWAGQTIAIGGLPSNTPGQSWYDFTLITSGSTYNFDALKLTYGRTGGTQASNNQNGFNVVNAVYNGNSANPVYSTTTSILSPYINRYTGGGNGIIYGNGVPIGLAWLPES
jgi:hypothetical protein